MIKKSIFFLVILQPLIQESRAQEIQRNDFFVESEPGISIFVREVINNNASTNAKTLILLIHGARVPGIASFDLNVPDGSLAEDLAKEGYPVYIMDARGYGYSTRPSAMSESPEEKKPLVRSTEAVQDIHAVVEKMRNRQSADQVSLLGWATDPGMGSINT